MIYPVIILIVAICTIVTLFLIKESFSSKRRVIFTTISVFAACITLAVSLITVFISFKEKKNELENKTSILEYEITILKDELSTLEQELQDYEKKINYYNNILNNYYDILSSPPIDFSHEIDTTQTYEKFIVFDNIPCYSISKNFNDTEINNTEFIFHNHPEEADNYNTLTLSFNLEKYSFFSSRISINDDNINNEEKIQTTIGFYNEKGEIIIEEKLNIDNPSSHIYINVSNLSTLTIIIKTNMIETDDDIFRTVSFSDINIE